MFLMYVDESGDIGLVNSPTRYFVLTGIVLHELRWTQYLEQLITFRKQLKADFGLRLREELHASALVNTPGTLARIPKYDRLKILRLYADQLASMSDLTVINIVVDKQAKTVGYDVFDWAWRTLIQRFQNTLSHHNFHGPRNADDRGLVVPDATDDKKLRTLMRKMRRFNPVPSQQHFGGGTRNLLLTSVVEDPYIKNSADSFFIQSADLVAYLLYQKLSPNKYMKSKSGNNYFDRLDPILCKVASSSDKQGIVYL